MAARFTTTSILPPSIQPISVTSLHSKFAGLRLQFPKLYVPCGDRITCRYGGGSNSRLEDSRRSQEISSDDDQALDVSSIRSNTVRLIDDQQNMVGIVSKTAAIQMAEDAELDLVILSPDADPPVVKLMDYNKYRYEQQKKKREQQKKSAALRMDQKELKMGYNIDVHDYSVRLRAAQKFLKDGDKVKVIVNLKGRENEFRNNAIELLNRFRNDIGELGIEESKNLKDRNMFMVLIPNKVVVQKEPTKKKRKSKSTETEMAASCKVDGKYPSLIENFKERCSKNGKVPLPPLAQQEYDGMKDLLSQQEGAANPLTEMEIMAQVLGTRRGFNRGREHIVPGIARYCSSSSSPGPSNPPPRVYTQEQLDEKTASSNRKYTRLVTQMKEIVKALAEHNIQIEVESDHESDDSD